MVPGGDIGEAWLWFISVCFRAAVHGVITLAASRAGGIPKAERWAADGQERKIGVPREAERQSIAEHPERNLTGRISLGKILGEPNHKINRRSASQCLLES
jgi:hypothetical protein